MAVRVDRIDVQIHVYPVGVLAELLRLRRALRYRDTVMIRWALGRCHSQVRYVARRLRAREWRSAKNAFNGYLAEPHVWPDLGYRPRRCGTGWTRRRALRSLRRRLR